MVMLLKHFQNIGVYIYRFVELPAFEEKHFINWSSFSDPPSKFYTILYKS